MSKKSIIFIAFSRHFTSVIRQKIFSKKLLQKGLTFGVKFAIMANVP